MDPRVLALLVCPVSGQPLRHSQATGELWCAASGLAYSIRDDVPVLLSDQARALTDAERESLLFCGE